MQGLVKNLVKAVFLSVFCLKCDRISQCFFVKSVIVFLSVFVKSVIVFGMSSDGRRDFYLCKAVTASRQALAAGAAAGDVSIVISTNSVAALSPVFVGEKKRGRNAFEDMEVPGFVTTE